MDPVTVTRGTTLQRRRQRQKTGPMASATGADGMCTGFRPAAPTMAWLPFCRRSVRNRRSRHFDPPARWSGRGARVRVPYHHRERRGDHTGECTDEEGAVQTIDEAILD